jgi:multimeric flavodoxin WrbA
MDKNALILDGRIGEDVVAEQPLKLATEWLTARSWSVSVLRLNELEIAPCVGCFGCWIKTPGECVIDDAGRDVAKAIVQSDLVVYLTPILFGGYSYELKKALDRSISIISPMFRRIHGEVHHKKRYARYPSILALGWLKQRTADEEDIFKVLVERNAINMHAPKALAEVFEISESAETMERRVEWALSKAVGS